MRDLRIAKGWTQQRLAERAGLTQTTVSMLESGKRQPSLASIKAIAGALDVDVNKLIVGASRSDEITYIQRVYAQMTPDDRQRLLNLVRSYDPQEAD